MRNIDVPQKSLFDQAICIRTVYMAFFAVSFIIAIVGNLKNILPYIVHISEVITVLSFALPISLFFLDTWFGNLLDKAENERRYVLMDHSYGTKYSKQKSHGYYDTDDIPEGSKRLLANIHESSIYTSLEATFMFKSQLIICVVVCVCMIAFMYIGFKNCSFSIPILEFFLSYAVIGKCIKLYSLKNSAETIDDKACHIWEHLEESPQNDQMVHIMSLMLQYESAITSNQVILSQTAKNCCDKKALSEWENRKERYNIVISN